MTKWLRAALALLVSLALAACGGGSDAGSSLFGGDGTGGGTTSATASDIVLVLDKTVVSNTGTETVTATAYALDANRNALANVPVVIRPDGTAISQPSGTRTGDAGTITSTVSLGNNLTNRTVTVTAVSGNIVRAATFIVAGTSGGPSGQSANDLAILLDKTIVSNSGLEKVTATVIALDTNRNAMSGIPVTVNVNADAIATVSGATTSSTGTVTAEVSLGNNLSNRSVTVTATSGGITRTAVFQVANSSGTTQTVRDVQIKLSAASVDNSGTQNVVATITALDANGKGMSGVPIVLAVDQNATYSFTGTSAGTTGEDGTVVANITIGNDLSIRTINVSATGGTVTKTTSFAVTGTKQVASDLTLALSSSVIQNSVNNFVTATITAVDATRNVLPNIPVALTVDNGASIAPSARVTDAAGKITASINIGADRTNRIIQVTAVSGSVTRVSQLEVRGAKLTGQASVSTVQTGATASITYLLVDNAGSKMAGFPVLVTAAGLADVTGTTDANGEYTYNYTAPATAGTLNINATAAGSPTTTPISVQSPNAPVIIPPATTDVASPSISVNPNVVAVNTPGATSTNKVEVRALFLSANNAPVKNVRVWFDLGGDNQSIGGLLDSAKVTPKTFLYTDDNGIARTSYAPGSRLSPKDGVTIRACWSKTDFAIPVEGGACPNVVTTTLTVISEALSVSIGTNGTIEIGPSNLTYIKRFAVQVVDSAGQAKADALVAPSIDLVEYYKGSWETPSGATKWQRGGYGNAYPTTYPGGAAVPYGVAADLPATAPTGSSTVVWQQDSAVPLNGAAVCANEDLNRNGVSENYVDAYESLSRGTATQVAEDVNGSASLNPQRPALDPRKADITVTTVGSSTTNSDGIVIVKIEYPQNIASWVKFNLLVSASGVAGTEGRANYVDLLPVEAIAVVNTNASPPFRNSPYGTKGSPTYPRKNSFGQAGYMCSDPN